MTERLPPGRILDRRPRGRCGQPLTEPCRCWRPRGHADECRCTCRMYPGSVHVAVPASHAGALVTDLPGWSYNGPLRREAL